MRSRRLWLALGVLLIPSAAQADDHRAGLFAGISFARGSTLVGFHESYEVTSPRPANRNLSVVGDFSVNFGSHDNGADVTQVPFMFGVRYMPTWLADHQKLVPFGQFLVGGVYTNDGVDDGTDGAFAFGGGVDFLPTRDASHEGWGVRAQFDYIVRGGEGDDIPRFSAGVVYRFRK
jgi:hypothetical protein